MGIGGVRMQDRFRYRVWDKTQNKWLHFDFSTYPTYQDRIWQALADGETFYQCTGLKDKNGKLIYEGDVISENWHKYVLEWGRGDFQLRDFAKGSVYTFPAGICIEKCEIIGNIYENKELLED